MFEDEEFRETLRQVMEEDAEHAREQLKKVAVGLVVCAISTCTVVAVKKLIDKRRLRKKNSQEETHI